MAQLATPDAVKLLQAFAAIESGDVRRALVTVAQR
jgi:Cdc6-like AAA superfamily ATPase